MPHAIRYSPTAAPRCVDGIFDDWNCSRTKNEIQNAPKDVNAVAPNVLLFRNSHMPARSCAIPPYANASPSTTGTPLSLTRPALKKLNTNVVSANAARPRGAGSPIAGATGGRTPERCSTTPSPFVVRRTVVASMDLPPFGSEVPGGARTTLARLAYQGLHSYREQFREHACCAGFRRGRTRRAVAGARRLGRGQGDAEEDRCLPRRRPARDPRGRRQA